MENVTLSQILTLAPNTRQVYRDAFASADQVLADYHINDRSWGGVTIEAMARSPARTYSRRI